MNKEYIGPYTKAIEYALSKGVDLNYVVLNKDGPILINEYIKGKEDTQLRKEKPFLFPLISLEEAKDFKLSSQKTPYENDVEVSKFLEEYEIYVKDYSTNIKSLVFSPFEQTKENGELLIKRDNRALNKNDGMDMFRFFTPSQDIPFLIYSDDTNKNYVKLLKTADGGLGNYSRFWKYTVKEKKVFPPETSPNTFYFILRTQPVERLIFDESPASDFAHVVLSLSSNAGNISVLSRFSNIESNIKERVILCFDEALNLSITVLKVTISGHIDYLTPKFNGSRLATMLMVDPLFSKLFYVDESSGSLGTKKRLDVHYYQYGSRDPKFKKYFEALDYLAVMGHLKQYTFSGDTEKNMCFYSPDSRFMKGKRTCTQQTIKKGTHFTRIKFSKLRGTEGEMNSAFRLFELILRKVPEYEEKYKSTFQKESFDVVSIFNVPHTKVTNIRNAVKNTQFEDYFSKESGYGKTNESKIPSLNKEDYRTLEVYGVTFGCGKGKVFAFGDAGLTCEEKGSVSSSSVTAIQIMDIVERRSTGLSQAIEKKRVSKSLSSRIPELDKGTITFNSTTPDSCFLNVREGLKQPNISRSEVFKSISSEASVMAQELFDLTDKEIKSAFLNDEYFDPSLFYRALEEYFNVNVYVLRPPEKEVTSWPSIVVPRHRGIHTRRFVDRECIIVWQVIPVQRVNLKPIRNKREKLYINGIVNDKDSNIKLSKVVNKFLFDMLPAPHTIFEKGVYVNAHSQLVPKVLTQQLLNSTGHVSGFITNNMFLKPSVSLQPFPKVPRITSNENMNKYNMTVKDIKSYFGEDGIVKDNEVYYKVGSIPAFSVQIEAIETNDIANITYIASVLKDIVRALHMLCSKNDSISDYIVYKNIKYDVTKMMSIVILDDSSKINIITQFLNQIEKLVPRSIENSKLILPPSFKNVVNDIASKNINEIELNEMYNVKMPSVNTNTKPTLTSMTFTDIDDYKIFSIIVDVSNKTVSKIEPHRLLLYTPFVYQTYRFTFLVQNVNMLECIDKGKDPLSIALNICDHWNSNKNNPGHQYYEANIPSYAYHFIEFSIKSDGSIYVKAHYNKSEEEPFCVLSYSINDKNGYCALLPFSS